ncbi:3-deoxy-manno-octulosonate cytidylyltransferase [Pelagibacterales bacterium SAG-MED08]|nr:3-deoxy-manno-octulosonate cytidylyltransferase [Pelagibacterales bacterium SAG-MED08]
MKTLIIIPSRLGATRLPGKPLLKINNKSIISHVFKRAQDADIGDVIVATENTEIVEDVTMNGGRAVLTSNKHKTGTDRIYEAFKKMKFNDVDLIMNLQGDEPAINIEDIVSLKDKMINYQSKMGTLAAKIENKKNFQNENIVKVETKSNLQEDSFSEAETFLRITKKLDKVYHHIGIYCYSVETLEKFVELNQTKNEIEQRLEQLRAIDNSIKINVALAKSPPIGVDTEEDYMALKKIMEYKDS